MENYVEFYSIHITLNVFLIKFGVTALITLTNLLFTNNYINVNTLFLLIYFFSLSNSFYHPFFFFFVLIQHFLVLSRSNKHNHISNLDQPQIQIDQTK